MTALRKITPGMQIDRYLLFGAIGTGGMGAVFKAHNVETNQVVALKVLTSAAMQRTDWVERFRREAQIGMRLRHPHLIEFHDWGEWEGHLFLAMELVDGQDLMQMIELHGRLGPKLSTRILRQVASALDHIWQEGIVHRDVKPSNILVYRREEKFYAKLGDLGLAKLNSEEDCRLTRDGHTVGTVDYMAPEQARNSQAADIRSDLYSLGCTLFHMLTGRPVFNQGAAIDRILAHVEKEAPDVRDFCSEVPPRLAGICRRLLAKHPDQRFQRPADLIKALSEKSEVYLAAPVIDVAHPTVSPPKRSVSRISSAEMALARPGEKDSDQRVAHFLFEQALQVLRSEQPEYATQLLLKCCRLDPAHIEYHETLREAQKELRGASPPHWWDSIARWTVQLRYRVAVWKGWTRSALWHGERLLFWNPRDVALQAELAQLAEQAGYDLLAKWMLEQACRIDRHNVELLKTLAGFHEKHGEIADALHCFEEMAELSPEDPFVQRRIQELSANNTLLQGDYENRLRERFRKHPAGRH